MKLIYRRGKLRVLRDGWRTFHVFFDRRLSMACRLNNSWSGPRLRCADIGLARTLEFYAGPLVLAFVGQELRRNLQKQFWGDWFSPTMCHDLATFHDLQKLERELVKVVAKVREQ